MSDLIVVEFKDEATALEARAELIKLQSEYLLEMEDVVVVTRDEKGKVRLHQAVNLTAAGAVSGSFWGLLVGMIFFNPLLGAAVGAGAGALSGKLTDIGINDEQMKELGETLEHGEAALFVLIRRATGDKVLERLNTLRGRGKLVKTSLSNEAEAKLRAVVEGDIPNQAPAAGA